MQLTHWQQYASVARRSFVMVPASHDRYIVIFDGVHQTMHIVDAPRPEARKIFTKWLRFANTLKRVAHRVLNQGIDTLQRPAILTLPVNVV